MKAIVLAILIWPLSIVPGAAETFTCKDEHFTTKYEIRGNKLLGYEDDYTGRPNVYDVLQNSRNGIIAIRHSPDILIWITIGRDGAFVRKLVLVSGSSYEESDFGYCNRKK